MEDAAKKTIVRVALSSIGLLIGGGTVIFHTMEDWTWIQSFYFTVVTLTTVGYGDLTPSTDATRLFTALFILLGVGTVAGTISAFSARRLKKRAQKRADK